MPKLAARLLPALVFMCLLPAFAHGQGSTASLAGVVAANDVALEPA